MALHSPRFANNVLLRRAAENNPPLVPGSISEAVRLVQKALIDLGFPMPISTRVFGSPDGIYGDETTAQVRAFQRKHGLNPDGIAGRNTLAKLDALLPGAAPALRPLFKVRLHLRSINIPHVSELTALQVVTDVYREYSIQVEMASGQSLLLTNEDQLRLTVIDGDCQWDQVSDDQRVLQGLGGRDGVGPTDILVYFATVLREKNGNTLQGCAGHPPDRPAAMVAATAIDQTTMAHEVGHVLLGSRFVPVHTADSDNLMCAAAICTGNPPILTPTQVATIRKSRFCKRL
jgi:hypothetical protein